MSATPHHEHLAQLLSDELPARLVIHHPDAVDDPYPCETWGELLHAVEQEAAIVASDAGSDLLSEPTQAARDELAETIVSKALGTFRAGVDYRDPAGIRWELDAS